MDADHRRALFLRARDTLQPAGVLQARSNGFALTRSTPNKLREFAETVARLEEIKHMDNLTAVVLKRKVVS